MPGIEPGASYMQSMCSAAELHPQSCRDYVVKKILGIHINFSLKYILLYFDVKNNVDFIGLECQKEGDCKPISLKALESFEISPGPPQTKQGGELDFILATTMHIRH